MDYPYLFERGTELATLAVALRECAHGRGRTVVIEGPAGIGKSSLLAAAVAGAPELGVQVLNARSIPLESDFAFGVVRQLFERRVARQLDADPALLEGAAALARSVVTAEASGLPPAPDAAFTVLHGLYWLCANLAERSPVVLCVDDLQWADAPSLRFLHLLATRLAELPVLLLVTIRTCEPSNDDEALAGLRRNAGDRVLAPRALSDAAVADVVEGALGAQDADFTRACHRATAGNPFYLRQLLSAFQWEGVPGTDGVERIAELGNKAIASTVLARVAAIPLGGRLAGAAAVLGEGAPLRHAAHLADLDLADAAHAADALVAADVLRSGDGLGFSHPMIRQAVYDDLGSHERSHAHHRAARVLFDEQAPAERVSAQLLVALPAGDGWAVSALRKAAGTALGRGEPGTAINYLRRALVEPPEAATRSTVLRELGAAELLVLDPAGLEHLASARALADDVLERAALAQMIARVLILADQHGAAGALLEETLHETRGLDRELTLTLEASVMGIQHQGPVEVKRSKQVELSFSRLPGSTPSERLALTQLGMLRSRSGATAADVIEVTERAVSQGLLDDCQPGTPETVYALGSLIFSDHYAFVDEASKPMLEAARARGSSIGVAMADVVVSGSMFQQGELLRAEEFARESVQLLHQAGAAFAVARALATLVDVLVDLGDLDLAAAELSSGGYTGPLPESVTFSFLLTSRANLRLANGEAAAALQDALAVGDRWERAGIDNPAFGPWRSLAALSALRLGDRDKALPLAAREVALADAFGAPRALGIALRAHGLCQGGDEGITTLERAVQVLAPSAARLEYARSLVDLGAALRRGHRRADAQDLLRQGLDIAVRCGARPLAERAGEELRATGARPRRQVLTGLASLTASERRVCALATQGLSNKDIAQSLFVTLGTVEMHLTRSYRKLLISSRAELTTALQPQPGPHGLILGGA